VRWLAATEVESDRPPDAGEVRLGDAEGPKPFRAAPLGAPGSESADIADVAGDR